MKKIILLITILFSNTICFSQMYFLSATATTVEGGVNVNVSTVSTDVSNDAVCGTVPFYLGYTSTVNETEINISLCYHISPLLQETTSNHNLFIATPAYNNYIVNLTIYSSLSPTVCDYNSIVNTASTPLLIGDFNEIANGIKILPNPAKDFLDIEDEHQKVKSIKFYNVIGQLVKSSTNLRNDVSDLTNGTYLIVLEAENESIVKKLIIQK